MNYLFLPILYKKLNSLYIKQKQNKKGDKMNLFIAKEALIYIGAPLLKTIITEIVKSTTTNENLIQIKTKFHNYLNELTGSTVNKFDDIIVSAIFDIIIDSEVSKSLCFSLLDLIQSWVSNSATQWDDKLVSPIIDELKKINI